MELTSDLGWLMTYSILFCSDEYRLLSSIS